jgi:hypothetical protein
MSNVILPIAKQLYICDDVVVDPISGKPHLVNLWDGVRASGPFPWTLAKLCVFVWWRGGIGRISSRIDIVEAGDGKVVRRTRDYLLQFAGRTKSLHAKYMIDDLVFDSPGVYFIELHCGGQFIDDQAIRVI